ncbi:cell envelope integrity protein TolA [Vibrio lamellibrachiae]|uniref:cell envelope integrity protein TolA n=1 Tax=Vibrio lamellibrachiae TaxID=2910253 RepID=UPI003D0B2738
MKESKPKNSDYLNPIVISIAMHVALVIALLWGTDFTMSEPEPSGNLVHAVVIDPNLVKQQAQKIRSQREAAAKKEQSRLDKLKRESEQLEKNRKAEEDRIRRLKEQQVKEAKATREAEKKRVQVEKERKAEEARVKKEREKAKKLEAERKVKEAEIKRAEEQRVAKQAAVAKAEKERIAQEKAAKEAKEATERAEKARIAEEKAAKEAAEKARQEKARLEQLERERKQQEAALNDIFAGMESENERNSSAQSKFAQSEAARYGEIYKQMIKQNLLVEESFKGKSCRVNLRLIPAGDTALLGKLSIINGDNRLCSATKRAVAQVNSFPLPAEQPSVVEQLKSINLTVEL